MSLVKRSLLLFLFLKMCVDQLIVLLTDDAGQRRADNGPAVLQQPQQQCQQPALSGRTARRPSVVAPARLPWRQPHQSRPSRSRGHSGDSRRRRFIAPRI